LASSGLVNPGSMEDALEAKKSCSKHLPKTEFVLYHLHWQVWHRGLAGGGCGLGRRMGFTNNPKREFRRGEFFLFQTAVTH
jgi:hypothetical protein